MGVMDPGGGRRGGRGQAMMRVVWVSMVLDSRQVEPATEPFFQDGRGFGG